ncbi:MAG: protein jag [Ktedonobacteraceae bacterium]|nr:protein jag [Ktedonobacteraceae bacterium]
MESIEASGKSVEEAIQQALARLDKRRDEVEIVVLQEPSRGTFGIGSKDARVRVTVKPKQAAAIITPEMADVLLGPGGIEVPLPEDEAAIYDDEFEEGTYEGGEEGEEGEEVEEQTQAPFAVSSPSPEATAAAPPSQGEAAVGAGVEEGELPLVETPSREDVEITVDVLQHILRYLNIHATVQVRSTSPLTLNIHGINENLGLLIGRRGETLAALQLLVNLIVSHRTRHRIRIIVDAENYRLRREENLRSLAQRVAQQVRNYRRSIALEAMPPHERRIVHLALSDSKDISTESIGEGDERRVVISLKRPGR